MATGIFSNTSMVVFEVDGAGKDQWVSFYHQSTYNRPNIKLNNPTDITLRVDIDDMGFGDQREY
jgi:hypothetical protein